jgi:hypothetical protein
MSFVKEIAGDVMIFIIKWLFKGSDLEKIGCRTVSAAVADSAGEEGS